LPERPAGLRLLNKERYKIKHSKQGRTLKTLTPRLVCKKIGHSYNAKQNDNDKKYEEAVAVAVETRAEDEKGRTCYRCTEAIDLQRRTACASPRADMTGTSRSSRAERPGPFGLRISKSLDSVDCAPQEDWPMPGPLPTGSPDHYSWYTWGVMTACLPDHPW